MGFLTFSPGLDRRFLLQPGAGLDVTVHQGLLVRFATDVLMLVDEGHLHNTPRVSLRAVVRF